jgi:hypothetical protein
VSAIASPYDRRHSVGSPASYSPPRTFRDPPSRRRTAPPRHAPWGLSDSQNHSRPGVDYFGSVGSPNIHLSPSPLASGSIPEENIVEEPEEDAGPTKSVFLRPPVQTYGAQRSSKTPSLRLDTSENTLVPSPIAPPRDEPPPGEPLEFRDVQENGSIIPSFNYVHYRWWPYFLLPDPHVLYITLFPTLHEFSTKTWLGKVVAVIAVPAVFCLTVTLPVVDMGTATFEAETKAHSVAATPATVRSSVPNGAPQIIAPKSPSVDSVPVARVWNRWLAGVQCILAPVFLTFILFRT